MRSARLPKGILIAPSLLSGDFSRLGQQVQQLEAEGADMLHFDVMDGKFAPNLTLGPDVVECLRPLTKLFFEVHLMVYEPIPYVARFAAAGADGITIHLEGTPNVWRTLEAIREAGCAPAIALNPHSPATLLEPVLEKVSLVLLMSVNPGFSGQKFIPEVLPKIAQVQQMLDRRRLEVPMQLDGGINLETAQECAGAGARIFVSGSGVFRNREVVAGFIAQLRNAARQARK